jgi:hypothetical protein
MSFDDPMSLEARVLARLRLDSAKHGPLTFRVSRAASGQPGFDLMTYRPDGGGGGSLTYLRDPDMYKRLPPATVPSKEARRQEQATLDTFYKVAAERINVQLMHAELFDFASWQSQSFAEKDQAELEARLRYSM